MKVAENRVGCPLVPQTRENVDWIRSNFPKFAMNCNNKYDEVITLAYVEVPLDFNAWNLAWLSGLDYTGKSVVIVAGSLLNPVDQLNRMVGRTEALKRLTNYLDFGIQKHHKDGRKADHFVLELSPEELKGTWQKDVAEFMISQTWTGKELDSLEAELAKHAWAVQ